MIIKPIISKQIDAYEVEENNLRYNYNNEEEIEEDSMNNYNEENNGEKKSKILKKKIKRKKAPKRKNYNPIIEMQKIESKNQLSGICKLNQRKF